MTQYDPVALLLAFGILALVPTLVAVTTSFLKIAIVMVLVRNALGVQQVPPNIAMYGLALILTAYVMAPVGNRMYEAVAKQPHALRSPEGVVTMLRTGAEPMRDFFQRNTKPEHRDFFIRSAHRVWGPEMAKDVQPTDFLILLPAFIVSELTSAFQIGFLLYLPFVVIDLIISNILLAMGMMMVSPVTISLPLKLFLFVAVDGWTRMIQGLVLSYA
jgi:type III secretion protein R